MAEKEKPIKRMTASFYINGGWKVKFKGEFSGMDFNQIRRLTLAGFRQYQKQRYQETMLAKGKKKELENG